MAKTFGQGWDKVKEEEERRDIFLGTYWTPSEKIPAVSSP